MSSRLDYLAFSSLTVIVKFVYLLFVFPSMSSFVLPLGILNFTNRHYDWMSESQKTLRTFLQSTEFIYNQINNLLLFMVYIKWFINGNFFLLRYWTNWLINGRLSLPIFFNTPFVSSRDYLHIINTLGIIIKTSVGWIRGLEEIRRDP